jgi:hypothetical protein
MIEMQKTDQKKLEAYSVSLSEKLANEFFSMNSHITGEQILKFTGIEQVNLFIIKNLFDKWKEENSKLRSPYFDYENAEVKEALNGLLVKLSQHISVKKNDFKLLLTKAIYDTFSMLLEPVYFLNNVYLNNDEISIQDLKEREKYIRINKLFLTRLIEKFEGQNSLIVSKADIMAYSASLSGTHSLIPEDSDKYFKSFSSMLKIEPNDILLASSAPVSPAQEEDFFKKVAGSVIVNEPAVAKEVIKEPTVVKDTIKEVPVVKVSAGDGMINEMFSKEFLTLNDKLRHEEGETLIQKHSNRKIADIKEAITLNQKFIFIKELVNGDAIEYNNMLSAIDQCDNYKAALHLLNDNYSVKWNWVQDKPEVKEFYAIVERKFN